jgi:hypothetical protein
MYIDICVYVFRIIIINMMRLAVHQQLARRCVVRSNLGDHSFGDLVHKWPRGWIPVTGSLWRGLLSVLTPQRRRTQQEQRRRNNQPANHDQHHCTEATSCWISTHSWHVLNAFIVCTVWLRLSQQIHQPLHCHLMAPDTLAWIEVPISHYSVCSWQLICSN